MPSLTHPPTDTGAIGAERSEAGESKELPMLLAEKPEPNPEWEAKADAAHAAIVAEVGPSNPFDVLTMLDKWKADAEPADCEGRISFSRALLDSAQDGLRAALEIARGEHLRGKAAFVSGAQECREMLARFVEQGGDPTTAGSIRANWNPEWGADPGPPRNMRDHGWLGPDLHDKAQTPSPATTPTGVLETSLIVEGSSVAESARTLKRSSTETEGH